MRLDRYLKSIYSGLPQSAIEKAIRKKQITLQGAKCSASSRVSGGEIISIPEGLQQLVTLKKPKPFSKASSNLCEKLFNEFLIHQDECLIAIFKPNNLASQGGTKVTISVDDALKHYNQKHNAELRLVHRLDSATSGIMLIAKDRMTAIELGAAFKNRLVKKLYLAITIGAPIQKSGTIVDDTSANTQYKLLRQIGKSTYLMAFSPKTGKMHQIRKHAQKLGCPIAGDKKYSFDRSFKNLMLHACIISIPKGIKAQEHRFRAPLPLHWKEFLCEPKDL